MSNVEAATTAPARKRPQAERQAGRRQPRRQVRQPQAQAKRQRRERLDVPAEKRWSTGRKPERQQPLAQHPRAHVHLFGKKVGVRMITTAFELDAWLQSQPDAA